MKKIGTKKVPVRKARAPSEVFLVDDLLWMGIRLLSRFRPPKLVFAAAQFYEICRFGEYCA